MGTYKERTPDCSNCLPIGAVIVATALTVTVIEVQGAAAVVQALVLLPQKGMQGSILTQTNIAMCGQHIL